MGEDSDIQRTSTQHRGVGKASHRRDGRTFSYEASPEEWDVHAGGLHAKGFVGSKLYTQARPPIVLP